MRRAHEVDNEEIKMETNNVIAQNVSSLCDYVSEHRTKVVGLLGVIALGVVTFFAYGWYNKQAQTMAHQAFTKALKEFERPVNADAKNAQGFATEEEKWSTVEERFRSGYERYRGSDIGSLFLAYQSTALVHLQKHTEAIRVMKQAVAEMKSPSVRSFYEVTLALMQLDSEVREEQEIGLNRLRSIAYDTKHLARGQALYHLGLYAWTHKKFDEVKNYWQMFLVQFSDQAGFEHYTTVVKDRLDLLGV